MPVNGPSPQMPPHGMWVAAPQAPSQPGTFQMRPGVQGQPTMMYAAAPGTPGQMIPRRMPAANPGQPGASPGMYGPISMDMQGRSPHHAPIGVPMPHMHVPPMFSPQPGQQPMYVPVGAGRGTLIPRPYEGYPPMAPGGYQAMPNASFMFQQS